MRCTFLFWFAGIFAAIGLVIVAGGLLVTKSTSVRVQGYYSSTGISTGKHATSHVSGGDSYFIEYQYVDRDGERHSGTKGASKREYAAAQPGERFPVNISEVRPGDSWIGKPSYVLAAIMLILGSCFLIPGATLMARQWRLIRRRVVALQRGQYVVGRVERVKPTNERVNGRTLYRVVWSWPSSRGIRVQGESPPLPQSAARHWKQGDEIAAYIHPSDPEFAEADFFGFRSR